VAVTPELGRIPFRIRIGVTGHRTEVGAEAARAVREQVRAVVSLLDDARATPVRVAVVSALAEGADRLVVREVREAAVELTGEAGRLSRCCSPPPAASRASGSTRPTALFRTTSGPARRPGSSTR